MPTQIIERQKFSLLETFILSICIFSLIFASIWGVLVQSRVNEDTIRIRNVKSIIKVLDQFYNDSSSIPTSRRFPISQCSTSQPNSIDYEHTLFIAITGIEQNSFKYLEPSDFPNDNKAVYSTNQDTGCLKFYDKNKYSKNNQQCNYAPANGKSFCYLYSTTPTGDTFTLAFYSDSKNKQIKITQIRDNQPISEELDLQKEIIK